MSIQQCVWIKEEKGGSESTAVIGLWREEKKVEQDNKERERNRERAQHQ